MTITLGSGLNSLLGYSLINILSPDLFTSLQEQLKKVAKSSHTLHIMNGLNLLKILFSIGIK